MDKDRADAIADAILHPDPRARAGLHAARARESRSLAAQRKVAAAVLAGFAVGAVAAWMAGLRFTEGGLWGGIAAGAAAWLWVLLVDRRRGSA